MPSDMDEAMAPAWLPSLPCLAWRRCPPLPLAHLQEVTGLEICHTIETGDACAVFYFQPQIVGVSAKSKPPESGMRQGVCHRNLPPP